jgi:hypothetical protein
MGGGFHALPHALPHALGGGALALASMPKISLLGDHIGAEDETERRSRYSVYLLY